MPLRQLATTEERLAALETSLDALIRIAEETDKRTDRIERLMWQSVGAIAVIILIGQFVLPLVLERISP